MRQKSGQQKPTADTYNIGLNHNRPFNKGS